MVFKKLSTDLKEDSVHYKNYDGGEEIFREIYVHINKNSGIGCTHVHK